MTATNIPSAPTLLHYTNAATAGMPEAGPERCWCLDSTDVLRAEVNSLRQQLAAVPAERDRLPAAELEVIRSELEEKCKRECPTVFDVHKAGCPVLMLRHIDSLQNRLRDSQDEANRYSSKYLEAARERDDYAYEVSLLRARETDVDQLRAQIEAMRGVVDAADLLLETWVTGRPVEDDRRYKFDPLGALANYRAARAALDAASAAQQGKSDA